MYRLYKGFTAGDVWGNEGYIDVEPVDISEQVNWNNPMIEGVIDYYRYGHMGVPFGIANNWYNNKNSILINAGDEYAWASSVEYILTYGIKTQLSYIDEQYRSYNSATYTDDDGTHTIFLADAYQSERVNPKLLPVIAHNPDIESSVYLGFVVVSSDLTTLLVGLVNIATYNIAPIDTEESQEGEESKPNDYTDKSPYYYKQHTNINIPSLPSSGQDFNEFYHVYKCDALTMRNFNGFLWTDSVYSGFVKMVGDPLNAIVNCMVFPFNVETNAEREYIILGNWDSRVASDVVSRQYQSIDMGTVKFEYNTASFLDSNPFSKVQIYLPYCGVYTLDPKDVISHTIGVEYHVDVLSGECMAFVTTTRFGSNPAHLILQANGNCCRNVQISAETSNKLVNSISGALSGAFAGGVSGGIGGALAGGVSGAVGGVAGKDSISTGGSYSGQVGFMSYQTPYIFADVPEYLRPDNYDRLNGRPAYIRNKVKNYIGFLSVDSIELDIPRATDEEKREIIRLLKQGVII